MAKRTTAQRRKAAKEAWARRRAKAELDAAGVPKLFAASAGLDFGAGQAPGYEPLAKELQSAFVQSSEGKGKERHANGRPFDRQPIMELTRLYGPGFSAGQAAKKAQEALGNLANGNFTKEKALAELHGAIVYLAAAASYVRG